MLATDHHEQRRKIGERTLLARRRQGLDQRPLAKRLGWGVNRISQIERAKVDLDLAQIYSLADALGCDVNYLIGATDDPGLDAPRTGKVDALAVPLAA